MENIQIEFNDSSLKIENTNDYDIYVSCFDGIKNNQPSVMNSIVESYTWWSTLIQNYVNFYLKFYKISNDGFDIEYINDYVVDFTNKNVLFELNPVDVEELDVWMSYINDKFQKTTKCKCYVKIKNEIISEKLYNIMPYDENVSYYIKYKIDRNDNFQMNILGNKNKSSYEIINNCLLRLK